MCLNSSCANHIIERRRIWTQKRVIKAVYHRWFEWIMELTVEGSILEIGGGIGGFKDYKPDSILTTDMIFSPWLDLVANGISLPFSDRSFSNVIMIDVLHHISRPESFLHEMQRVLRPGGRLIMLEPWITPFSYIFYRFFHLEFCSFDGDRWKPVMHINDVSKEYAANVTLPYRILKTWSDEDAGRFGLTLVNKRTFIALDWLLSRGFQPSSWISLRFLPWVRRFESLVSFARSLCSTRVIAAFSREEQDTT